MSYKDADDLKRINELTSKATGISFEEKRNNNRGAESLVFARDDQQKPKAKTKEEREKERLAAEAVEEELFIGVDGSDVKASYTKFEWNTLVGIQTPGCYNNPLTEEIASLPTKGVTKKNGEHGLDGEPVQDIKPKASPANLDMDSDADVIESVEPTEEELAEAFEYFLTDNELTMEQFSLLTTEAVESGSADQMSELVTFQGIFESRLDEILGFLRAMKAKKMAMKDKNKTNADALWKKARETMAKDPAGVRAANKAGKAYVAPEDAKKGKLLAMKNKKLGYGGSAVKTTVKKRAQGESVELVDDALDEAVPTMVKTVRNNKRGLINSMDRKKETRSAAKASSDPLVRGKNQKPNTAGIADNANPRYKKVHDKIMGDLKNKPKLPESLEAEETFLESLAAKYE
jgi:hypothetical protein